MSKSSVTFWSGVGTVTGANFLLEKENFRALIDCGMLQGVPQADFLNKEAFPYDVHGIDALFVTHAHVDHIGRIPQLVKSGFRGSIYSTEATRDIAEIMLADAARIIDAEARNMGTLPAYSTQDVAQALSLWKTFPYYKSQTVAPEVSVELRDAGHILGSAMFLFSLAEEAGEKRILFTGDLGNSPSLLIRDTDTVSDADIMVIDSVYGDRNHEDREQRSEKFASVVRDIVRRKATLVIPAFSLERTQMLLYELNELIESNVVESVPVFLDSPLAIRLTEIYARAEELYNKEVKADIKGGDNIFSFPRLKLTRRSFESKEIGKTEGAKIIIAGSGMSTAGRVLHHEAKYLPDPEAVILLTGYQAPQTLGRQLAEGAKTVTIADEGVSVRARIETILGYSGHKDADHLLEFVEQGLPRLKKVFVVLGEPKSSLALSQKIRDHLGVETVLPKRGISYPL